MSTTTKADDRPVLILRLPAALKRKIQIEAAKRSSTQQDVAAEILADHFGVRYESRWPKTRNEQRSAKLRPLS